MAYQEPETPASGNPISSANFGIKVVNSIKELWKYAAAGDVVYAASATTLAKLAGVAYKWLGWNGAGTALEAKDPPCGFGLRVGGNATDWRVPGSTNYSANQPFIQCGSVEITIPSGEAAKAETVTWPYPYSQEPLIFLQIQKIDGFDAGDTYEIRCDGASLAKTYGVISLFVSSNQEANRTNRVSWMTLGEL